MENTNKIMVNKIKKNVSLKKEAYKQLDQIKLIYEETYNSVILRILRENRNLKRELQTLKSNEQQIKLTEIIK